MNILKKYLLLFLPIVIFSAKLPEKLQDYLNSRDSLIAFVDADYPPFSFINRRDIPDGFNVDIAREIGRIIEKEIVLVPICWKTVLKGIGPKNFDFYMGLHKTFALDDIFDFSEKMLINEFALFLRAGSDSSISLPDMVGKKVAFEEGEAVAQMVHATSGVQAISVGSSEEGLRKVMDGEVDAFIGSIFVVDYIMKNKGWGSRLTESSGATIKYEYCIAVPEENQEMLEIVEFALAEIKSHSVFESKYEKWFGRARIKREFANVVFWVIAILLLAFIFLIAMLQRTINRQKKLIEYQRRSAENLKDSLSERDNRFEALSVASDNLKTGLFIIKDTPQKEGAFVFVNSTLSEIAGYSEEELLKMSFTKFFSGKDFDTILSRYRLRKKGEPQPETYEIQSVRADGHKIPLEISVNIYPTKEGQEIVGFVRDMSRLKAIQEKLKHSDQNFRSLISGLPFGALIVNRERIIYVNNALRKIVGKTPEEIRARGLEKLVPPIQLGKIESAIEAILSGRDEPKELGFEILRMDGSIVPVSIRFRKVNYFGELAVLMLFEDTSEISRRVKRIGIDSKVEGLGRIAENVILEYNNTLMGIIGAISQIRRGLPNDSSLLEYVSIVEKDAERAASLTEKILAFSSAEEELPGEIISINDMVLDALSLIPTEKENIIIEKELSAKPDTIKGNLSQVHQAILNLIINAVEAMKFGGVIKVKTGNITVDAEFRIEHPEADRSRYVWVSVADTGKGIPPEMIENIFEPFFTTKEFGAGAGLGLSLVHKVVKRHKGFIDIESELDKGSLFTIYFPEEIEKMPSEDKALAIEGGNETILVADDEPNIRTILKALLTDLGYNVLLAENGLETIDIIRSKGDEIKLVILDIVMPGMSGFEAFSNIKALNPEIKIIVSTGYAREESIDDLLRQGANSLIRKPYHATTIAKTIRDVLDNSE